MKKLIKDELIIITWEDILQVAGWLSLEAVNTTDAIICKSVGWLISEDKKYIRITSNISSDGDMSIVVIPKGTVKSIERVGEINGG